GPGVAGVRPVPGPTPPTPSPVTGRSPSPTERGAADHWPLCVVALVAAVQVGDAHVHIDVHIDGDGRWHGLAGAGGLQALQLVEGAVEVPIERGFVARKRRERVRRLAEGGAEVGGQASLP